MAPWDRKSSNGSGSMLNGRNNEGSIGTWNSSMINNGVKKESNNWGDDSDCHGLGMAGAVDDGTNLWGGNKQSQHQSQSQMGQQHQRNNMRWNDDLGMNDGRMKTPNGPQNNMNNNMMMMSSGSGQFGGPTSPGRMMGNNMKPNGMNKANMNNQANNSNSWNNNDMNNANWNDYSKAGQIPSSGGNAHSKAGAGVWNDNASMHWNGHKNQNGGSVADSNEWSNSKRRMVNREMILSSNQYRILVEMGFKKEDVENALRTCNMNLEDTLEELRPISVREASFDADRQKVRCLILEFFICFAS